ncbi:helix-turn-helix domain-containing protein [Saccharothrix texasensis]|uniref:helix-turn-helix domain-containing protein n=1 Tax=Saccharothrix texasensis TaxID=103734 RepID=UPI003CCC659B
MTTAGVHPASSIRRAQVLLELDISVGEPDPKEVIAARLGVSGEMLRLVARRFAETGGDALATVSRKKRDLPPVPSPVTGEVEARLIALACSQPPAGFARWSLRLLEKHVELTEDARFAEHSRPLTPRPEQHWNSPLRRAADSTTAVASPHRIRSRMSQCRSGGERLRVARMG